MLNTFDKDLAARLHERSVSSQVSEQLVAQSADFLNIKIPDNVSGETQTNIRQAIRKSFVSGFRVVACLAAALAAASAIVSWLLIRSSP